MGGLPLLLRVAESVERLAGVNGVAGLSTAVRMKPRTFAQDDSVRVGECKGTDLSPRPDLFMGVLIGCEAVGARVPGGFGVYARIAHNGFVRIAVATLIDSCNRDNSGCVR
jgi:hypothetical protein